MAEKCNLIHERVDDIPLLIGLMQHLHMPEIIDKHIGNHGHHIIANNIKNNGFYNWIPPILDSGTIRVKAIIQDKNGNTLAEDTSNNNIIVDSTSPVTMLWKTQSKLASTLSA